MKPEFIRMKIIELGYEDQGWKIHARGEFADYTICGEDIAGDGERVITKTKKQIITCEKCIRIIKYCKAIDDKYCN